MEVSALQHHHYHHSFAKFSVSIKFEITATVIVDYILRYYYANFEARREFNVFHSVELALAHHYSELIIVKYIIDMGGGLR